MTPHTGAGMATRLQADENVAATLLRRFTDQWYASGVDYDLDTLLAGAGIHGDAAAGTAHGVDLRGYYRLLQLAAPLLVQDGFFLRLGRSYDLFDLGILGYALYSAANLRRSWDISLGQSSGLVPHPSATRRWLDADHAGIVVQPPSRRADVNQALYEEWLAGTWRWTWQRLPELADDAAMEVHLDFPAPAYRDLYDEIFPGRVRFAMPQTALLIPRTYYERPFTSANPSIARLCYQESVATMAAFQRSGSLVDDVRFYLLQNARIPFPTLAETASAFQLPAHTLHRRLRGHGRTFRDIRLEVRMVLARQYLSATSLSVQEVAFAVGYEQVPSFVRAFRDWHGVTPGAWREGAGDAGTQTTGGTADA